MFQVSPLLTGFGKMFIPVSFKTLLDRPTEESRIAIKQWIHRLIICYGKLPFFIKWNPFVNILNRKMGMQVCANIQ